MEVVHKIHLEAELKRHQENLVLTTSCRVQISFAMKVCTPKCSETKASKIFLQGLRDENTEPQGTNVEVSLESRTNSYQFKKKTNFP